MKKLLFVSLLVISTCCYSAANGYTTGGVWIGENSEHDMITCLKQDFGCNVGFGVSALPIEYAKKFGYTKVYRTTAFIGGSGSEYIVMEVGK